MTTRKRIMHRWEDYRASKTVVFWTCIISIIATIVVGFGWGGWMRGGSAQEMAMKAADEARAEIAATVCVDRLSANPAAAAQLATLRGNDAWKRNGFIEEGGWATPPGMSKSVSGASGLCSQQLLNAGA